MNKFSILPAFLFLLSSLAMAGCDDGRLTGSDAAADVRIVAHGPTVPPCPPPEHTGSQTLASNPE